MLVPVSLSTMARFLSWAFCCSFERHLASQLGYWPPSFKIGYPVSQLATQFHNWLPSFTIGYPVSQLATQFHNWLPSFTS